MLFGAGVDHERFGFGHLGQRHRFRLAIDRNGVPISTATASHLEFMIFGALIIFFLIVEPHGFARLWQIAKEKLRLWPFPH